MITGEAGLPPTILTSSCLRSEYSHGLIFDLRVYEGPYPVTEIILWDGVKWGRGEERRRTVLTKRILDP